MRKESKPFSKIVPWYKRNKYEPAELLTAKGWYQQLLVRKIINIYLRVSLSEPNNSIREAINYLREKPIINMGEDKPFLIFLPFSFFANPIYAQAIHPLTMAEFCKVEESMPREKLRYTRKWLKQNHLTSRVEYHSWIDEPINNILPANMNSNGVLHVNYDLPLPVLIKQFEQHVADKKTSMNTTIIKNRKADFQEWHRLGVLPYIDLKIWEEEAGIKLTHNQISDALNLSVNGGGEDSVRRVTKKLADKLLSNDFLEELAALAMLE